MIMVQNDEIAESVGLENYSVESKTPLEIDLKANGIKRKTIGIGGRSISVRQNTYSFSGRIGRKKIGKRDNSVKTAKFSKSFLREFGHLIVGSQLEKSLNSASSRLPIELNNFVDSMIFKYSESHDPELLRRRRNYASRLAEKFLADEEDLIRRGIKPEKTIDYCKRFIEYGFFLRSLYGDKFIQVRTNDFFGVLKENGNLDPKKLRSRFDDLERGFKEELVVEGSSKQSKERLADFDLYIAYKTMHYFNKEEPEKAKNRIASAKTALGESITKYDINDSNINQFLKLSLQHIDWGVTQRDLELRHSSLEKLQIYGSDEERERILQIAAREKLYLVSDIFHKLGIKDNVLTFYGLVNSEAQPIITRRADVTGYFVTREGASQIMKYFDGVKLIDYRRLRVKNGI